MNNYKYLTKNEQELYNELITAINKNVERKEQQVQMIEQLDNLIESLLRDII